MSDESQGRGIHVVTTATPRIWKWQFRIGEQLKTGKTETRINLLAIRRVQLRIDRELGPNADKRRNAEIDPAALTGEWPLLI